MSKKTKQSDPAATLPPPPAPSRDTVPFRLIAAGLALFTLLFFWRATGFGFVFPGETTQLLTNAKLTGSAGLGAAFSLNQPWQPLAWLSHMLDFSLFGPKPEAQRAVNLLLHAANTALLFLLFRRWLGTRNSALLAALFAIHPLRVEPVIWLVERRMLLATFFVLLAVRIYVARSPGLLPRGLVFLFGTLAALSHPAGATLPFLLLLVDVWPLDRTESWAARLMEKLELMAVALGTLVMSARAAHNPEAVWVDLGERIHAASGLGMALIRTAFPFPLTIMNALAPPWWAALVLVAVCVLAMLQRHVALRVGLGWFLIAMVPTLGLLNPEIAPWSDSGTYLAHIGLLAALVWLGARWDGDKLLAICFTVALVWLGLSWLRVGEWRNSESMLRAAIARSGHPLAHYQLGQMLVQAQRGPEAEKEFREVLRVRPKHLDSQLLLASALLLQKRNGEATELYRQAIRAAPDRAETYVALGLLETSSGQTQEGLAHLHEGIKRGLTPELEAQAENAIGVYLLNQKQYDAAEPHLRRSWTLVPAYASAHRNYALTLDGMGQSRRAFTHIEKRARLFTKDAPEVVEVWAMLFNKLAAEEKKKADAAQREAAAARKKQ